MIPARRVDLHGSIETRDASGHRAVLNFHGNHITVELDSIRAALAARRATRSAFPVGVLSVGRSSWLSAVGNAAQDFELQVCIRGRKIGVAGGGVHPNWLGTRLAGFPVNVNLSGLLRAMLRAF